MNWMKPGPCQSFLLAASMFAPVTLWAQTPAAHEPPPVFKASQFLPENWLKGNHHQVREDVPTASLLRHYTIDSTFGTYEAFGDIDLGKTLAEIRAITLLQKIADVKSAGDALGSESTDQVGIVGKLATDPGKTAMAVPKGAFRMMKRVGASLGQLKDKSQPKTDPIRIYLGMDAAHQELATQLGVSPYSTNQLLQKELNRVAGIASLGNTAIRTLVPWSLATTFAEEQLVIATITDLYGIPSPDLYAANQKQLDALGIDRRLGERLLQDQAYDPVQETVLIRALSQLQGATGLESYLILSCQAIDRVDAASYQRTAALIALHHTAHEPIRELTNIYGYPVFVTATGRVVAPVYGEYASWTQNAEQFIGALKTVGETQLEAKGVAIFLSGQASPRVKQELQARGIQLIENAIPFKGFGSTPN